MGAASAFSTLLPRCQNPPLGRCGKFDTAKIGVVGARKPIRLASSPVVGEHVSRLVLLLDRPCSDADGRGPN